MSDLREYCDCQRDEFCHVCEHRFGLDALPRTRVVPVHYGFHGAQNLLRLLRLDDETGNPDDFGDR